MRTSTLLLCRGAFAGRFPPGYLAPRGSGTSRGACSPSSGEPAYRARQVWEWAARGAAGYDAMTNVPRRCARRSPQHVPFSTLAPETEQRSRDGTVKTLFRTHDGHPVEAVLMRYRDGRRSVCVSSQSGCPLTCTFCATGRMALRAQPHRRGRSSTRCSTSAGSEPVNHVVFMGMGEPFMNVDAVLEAARRLPDVGITHRRTTISTVGWLPGLRPVRRGGRGADPARALAPRGRPGAPERADAGERPVPARGRARTVPRALGAHEATRLRRVRDARRASTTRPAQARALAGLLGRDGVQGEPHSLQPDRHVRRLVTGRDRRIQGASWIAPASRPRCA